MTWDGLFRAVILVPAFAPLALLLGLGIPALLSRPLREPFIGRLVPLVMAIVFLGNTIALVAHAFSRRPAELVSMGFELPTAMGAFAFDFLADSKSLTFAALSALLCGIVAAFSNRYLHRDPGFNRYFVLFAAFVLGTQLVALAGSIEVLIAGWELLGLSSALLVGFFHDRRAPVANAFRVFAVYRIGDVAMLSAAVLLHQTAGSGSLLMLFSSSGTTALPAGRATLIALLILAAVAAKSALFPLSGWLPRAMEGPTPSSAVYYGAVSIHAGCFLLLRASPVLEQSLPAQVVTALVGLTTAVYAAMSARVQADRKSALAYDALTHVGLIVVEIALGLETIALFHMAVHMSFRLIQFLSAPNILHDLHGLVVGNRPRAFFRLSGMHSRGLYLFALERGFLDALLDRAVVVPFLRLARAFDAMDQSLCGRRGPGRVDVVAGELKND